MMFIFTYLHCKHIIPQLVVTKINIMLNQVKYLLVDRKVKEIYIQPKAQKRFDPH